MKKEHTQIRTTNLKEIKRYEHSKLYEHCIVTFKSDNLFFKLMLIRPGFWFVLVYLERKKSLK